MINVIGLGYIGLQTALMLATNGNEVVGVDTNREILNTLNQKKLTFEEKGLAQIFSGALKNGIRFQESYSETDFYIVTVPTPYDKYSRKIDPSYIVSFRARSSYLWRSFEGLLERTSV